jgi:hypothetical protein
MAGKNPLATGHDHNVLDPVFQLSDIAGPGAGLHPPGEIPIRFKMK